MEGFLRRHISKYKKIAAESRPDRKLLDSVLELVQQFISQEKLIIYGGLAIDYSLRLKGSKIYDDDAIPDYDFFSPENIKHAVKLARFIHSRHPRLQINVIRRINVYTYAVQVNYVVVADISYIPAEIYTKIPTLEYKQMRIAHPDWLRCDLHLSLNNPYDNAPRENISHRFAKDYERYNLINKYYSITTEIGDLHLGEIREKIIPVPEIPHVIAGIGGLALICECSRDLGIAPSLPLNISLEPSGYKISAPSRFWDILGISFIVQEMPFNDPAVEEYNPLLHMRPRMFVKDGIQYLLLTEYRPAIYTSRRIQAVNAQFICMQLLEKVYFGSAGNPETLSGPTQFARYVYSELLTMLERCGKEMSGLDTEIILSGPFCIGAKIFMTQAEIESESNKFIIYAIQEAIGEHPPILKKQLTRKFYSIDKPAYGNYLAIPIDGKLVTAE